MWIFPLTLCTSWMKWLVYHKVGYRKLNYLKTSLELFLNNCTCTRNTSCNNHIIQHTDKDWNNWNKCCIKLFHVNSVLSNLTLKKIETHGIFFVGFFGTIFRAIFICLMLSEPDQNWLVSGSSFSLQPRALFKTTTQKPQKIIGWTFEAQVRWTATKPAN